MTLRVEAEARCATTASLAERVHRHSQKVRFVDDAAEVPHVHIRIEAGPERGRTAELTMRWPDGRHAERRLAAGSCESALDALALLLAMTLDPDVATNPPPDAVRRDQSASTPQRTGEASSAPAEAAPEKAPQPSVAQASGTPDAGPAAAEPTGSKAAAPEGTQAADADTTAPSDMPSRWARVFDLEALSLGVGANLISEVAPGLMPGFGLWALLSFEGAGFWRPALGLQLAHNWLHDVPQSAGDASFDLDSVELTACPLGARLGSFSAHACAALSLGRLRARGENSYAPRAYAETWACAGASVLSAIDLGNTFRIMGGFELMAPLSRYRFAFGSDVFHTVAAAVFEAHLGAGVRFP